MHAINSPSLCPVSDDWQCGLSTFFEHLLEHLQWKQIRTAFPSTRRELERICLELVLELSFLDEKSTREGASLRASRHVDSYLLSSSRPLLLKAFRIRCFQKKNVKWSPTIQHESKKISENKT